jgi:pimeloyl-ACP methyl ester carboxylesterase
MSLPVGSHVVSLDFRGHGKSDVPQTGFTLEDLADDAACLADHLRLPHVILVGHSLGGMAAMALARRSTRVVGLVLLEGWTSLPAANAFDSGRFYGTLPQSTVERIDRKASETKARFRPRIWDGFWQSAETFDAFAYLERASIPIVKVYGEMGRNRTTEQELRVPPNPYIEWIWIPNAGHYLPHERPGQVAAACVRELQRVQAFMPPLVSA